jgi:ADP-heptose:LPS heptosyltransferase
VSGPRFDAKSSLLARLIALVFFWVPPLRQRRTASVGKILIVRPDRRVGNQVITSALVLALAKERPEIEVHYLAPEGRDDLLRGLPGLKTVHVLPRHPASQIGAVLTLLRQLRSERFDCAIDASHWHSFSLTSALLTRLSGAAWTLGHARPGAAALLGQWVAVPHQGSWPRELDVKLSLLEPLGLSGQEPRMALPDAPGSDEAMSWWAEHATRSGRVLLWPTTRKASTEIPAGHWPHVLSRLPLPESSCIAVGWGPGEEALAAQLVRALRGEGFEAAALPDTTIAELAHFMNQADVVVSGDTGPMHVAGACTASVFGVFRQDDGARWLPPGADNRGFNLSDHGDLVEFKR